MRFIDILVLARDTIAATKPRYGVVRAREYAPVSEAMDDIIARKGEMHVRALFGQRENGDLIAPIVEDCKRLNDFMVRIGAGPVAPARESFGSYRDYECACLAFADEIYASIHE